MYQDLTKRLSTSERQDHALIEHEASSTGMNPTVVSQFDLSANQCSTRLASSVVVRLVTFDLRLPSTPKYLPVRMSRAYR